MKLIDSTILQILMVWLILLMIHIYFCPCIHVSLSFEKSICRNSSYLTNLFLHYTQYRGFNQGKHCGTYERHQESSFGSRCKYYCIEFAVWFLICVPYMFSFDWQVSLPVVRRFVQAVSDQAVGTGVIRGVKPDQQLVKVCLYNCYTGT